MNISNAQYNLSNGINVSIQVIIDGQEMSVPLDPANRHYAEILKQVQEGTLTIQDAD
tara:strand:- start:181 stop:351 length:171 start_codon:yes stop_codon:yes gene_type:complete